MSYSRWGKNSSWYLWWDVSSGETKDNQVLAIWHKKDPRVGKDDSLLFTYRKLVDSRDEVINYLREGYKFKDDDEATLNELIDDFIEDMDGQKSYVN